MKKLLLFAVFFSLGVVSCQKPITQPNAGLYKGILYRTNTVGDTIGGGVGHLAIFEAEGKFGMDGDTVSYTPANHNGNFSLQGTNFIIFENLSSIQHHPEGYLDGTYQYTFDNIHFRFWKETDTSKLEYIMQRY
jgi:hypothetical protein